MEYEKKEQMKHYEELLRTFFTDHTKDVMKQPRSFIRYPFIDPGSIYDGNVWDWDTYWSVYGFLNLADSYEDPSVKPRIIEHAQGNIRNFFDHQLEDGYMEIAVQTPCLLTCIKELNTPRYMSVSGVFACYDKPIEVFDYNALKDDPLIETDTIGLKGSPTNVYKSFAPPVKGAGQMVESASQLVGILNDKHLI